MEERIKLYEAMFLVDSAQAGSDWDGTMAAVNRVLERANAEIVSIRKWADRKMAFQISKKNRGTYILAFFKTASDKIAGLEKDVNLSEDILRVLILTTDGRPAEMLDKDIKGETKPPSDYHDPAERFEAANNRPSRGGRGNYQKQEEAAPEAGEDAATATEEAPAETDAPATDADDAAKE